MPKTIKNTIKDLLKAFAQELLVLAAGHDKGDALTIDEEIDILLEKYLGE